MTKARDLANIITGGFTADDIPNIDTAKITSGTLGDARIPNLATSKITSGTFADARLPATALNSNVDLTNLSASNLTSGTVADARLPSTALNSNVDLTNLSATNMTSGTLPDARFPSTLPAVSGASLTNLPASGITGADFWRLNTDVNFGADSQVLNSNWERVDADGYGVIGSAMSESSGIFTFPTTGIWVMYFQASASRQSGQELKATYFRIQTTENNSSYSTASQGVLEHDSWGTASSCSCSFIFDVTSTSNCKVRTEQYETQGSASNVNVLGGTADTVTGISFIRLADT